MDKPDIDPARLLHKAEERPIGVSVPVPISKRLDLLVKQAEAAGVRVYRKDLVAVLILAAPETSAELLELFLHYRKADSADAGLENEPDAAVLKLERPKPGRRPRAP